MIGLIEHKLMIQRGKYKYPIPANETEEKRQQTHASYLTHRDACLQCSAWDSWPYGGALNIQTAFNRLCLDGFKLFAQWMDAITECVYQPGERYYNDAGS